MTTQKTVYKQRAGWGYWRWVHIRHCAKCGAERHILGNNSKGHPQLGKGAIMCECGGLIPLG